MGFLKQEVTVEIFLDAIKERFNKDDQDLIKRAYDVAEKTHEIGRAHV